jgi:hypothetical protein
MTQRSAFQWIISFPDEKTTTVGRPCLRAACRGNERISLVLNYFIYEASLQAQRHKLDLATTKVVVLQRTLDQMLTAVCVSKKTLIGYLDRLNAWGFVLSQPYQREYTVCIEAITAAIREPPPRASRKKPPSVPASEGCTSTTLQPDNVELAHKVVELQSQVELLQRKVVELQSKVEILQPFLVLLQPYNLAEPASDAAGMEILKALRLREYKREERKENVYDTSSPTSCVTDALASGDTTHRHSDTPDEEEREKSHPSPAKGTRSTHRRRANELELTPEGAKVLERWQMLRHKPLPRTSGLIRAANQLGPCDPSSEDLKAVELHCYATDTSGYYNRGVKLWDIAREFEGWQSAQARAARGTVPTASTAKSSAGARHISSFDDPDYDMSDEFYPSETERRQHAAAPQATAPRPSW